MLQAGSIMRGETRLVVPRRLDQSPCLHALFSNQAGLGANVQRASAGMAGQSVRPDQQDGATSSTVLPHGGILSLGCLAVCSVCPNGPEADEPSYAYVVCDRGGWRCASVSPLPSHVRRDGLRPSHENVGASQERSHGVGDITEIAEALGEPPSSLFYHHHS